MRWVMVAWSLAWGLVGRYLLHDGWDPFLVGTAYALSGMCATFAVTKEV